jgi:hypothetical protein
MGGQWDPEFVPAPTPAPPKPAMPHFWTGPTKFLPSVVFTARLVQRSKKSLGQHFIFLQLQIQFFFPQKYYIGPRSFKNLELHSCF